MKNALFLSMFVFLFPSPSVAGWWPFSSNNENINVNTYFYSSDGKEVSLGQHKSASACQSAAINYANSKGMGSDNWDYICCTIEKGSSCFRKIR